MTEGEDASYINSIRREAVRSGKGGGTQGPGKRDRLVILLV